MQREDFVLKWFVSIFGIIFSFALFPASGLAISISSAQDCDANAVIRCGLSDTSNAVQSYQASGVADIYNYFGISRSDIGNLDSQAVAGRVTSDGRVIVNSRVVATSAMTAGRQNMPGSTAVRHGSTTFYARPPSVSFASSSLPSYVVMDSNGRFSYAIIASCGNPVMATPVPVPAKKTKPVPATPVTPAVKPSPAAAPAQQAQAQSQVQSQTVVYNVPTPAPAAQPAVTTPPPTPAPATKSLPNTGPGNIVGLGALSAVFGSIGHFYYSRRKTS